MRQMSSTDEYTTVRPPTNTVKLTRYDRGTFWSNRHADKLRTDLKIRL